MIGKRSKDNWQVNKSGHIYFCLLTSLNSFLLPSFHLNAQVANNNIHESSALEVDAKPLFSTTDKSTVEWDCINRKLTERCLIYHNDQWFTFTPNQSGTLFLNVLNQQCRKKFGVQVLVIEGNPCETSSYKLLHCESFTNQSDTFIKLDLMKADKPYLINIDGFLADVCGFEIQVGTKPIGLPHKAVSLNTLHLSVTQSKNIVTLNWSAPQSVTDSVEYFEIYRQATNEFKNKRLSAVPIQFNALGIPVKEYSFTDTLTQHDTYTYLVVGVQAASKIILDKKQITFYPTYKKGREYVVKVPLPFTKKGDVDFLIINAANDQVLFKKVCVACKDQEVEVDLTDAVKRGILRFWIKVFHTKTKEKFQYTYYVNKQGEVVMKTN